jgi:glycosyltransferase involved in cell wall biosynthesis
MRITIVGGFFLPIPALAGGAMEKAWSRLGEMYAERGHTVTQISRRWPGLAREEVVHGVHHLRLGGYDHRRKLWQNLALDSVWGAKVLFKLPPADILITNTVSLPIVVHQLRPQVGRLVVNLNRFPKGQLRLYGGAARIQAASRAIAVAAVREAPALADRIRIAPNPVEMSAIAAQENSVPARADPTVVMGYFGRLHPEKGLARLVAAASRLLSVPGLPPWRLELRGAVSVPHGGGGEAFVNELRAEGAALRAVDRLRIQPPLYDPAALHRAYYGLDVFCYPTLAEHGEALPIAVLEAMAARLPVVVTDLDCFADYVNDGINGLVVQRNHTDPVGRLADALHRMIADANLRRRLGDESRKAVALLDDPAVADSHLADYASLLHSGASCSA